MSTSPRLAKTTRDRHIWRTWSITLHTRHNSTSRVAASRGVNGACPYSQRPGDHRATPVARRLRPREHQVVAVGAAPVGLAGLPCRTGVQPLLVLAGKVGAERVDRRGVERHHSLASVALQTRLHVGFASTTPRVHLIRTVPASRSRSSRVRPATLAAAHAGGREHQPGGVRTSRIVTARVHLRTVGAGDAALGLCARTRCQGSQPRRCRVP